MSVYVGIDVHRKRSQVAVVAEDGQVQVARAARLVAAGRAGGYCRTGHVEPSYLWPVQAFADWAESHSAPGLTRCG
jgi:hypothetical protein